jgi:hypothetical protein
MVLKLLQALEKKISVLSHNGEGVGIFQFSAKKVIISGLKSNYANEPITRTLDFVQGIKKLTAGAPFLKGWQEIIVNSFILSIYYSSGFKKKPKNKSKIWRIYSF